MSARRTLALFLAPLALAACGGGSDADRNLDSLDAELSGANSSGRAQDPAITAALRDQIMVDPQLAAQSNRDAVRPPSQPYSAPVPDVKGAPSAPADARTSEIARAAPAPGARTGTGYARREGAEEIKVIGLRRKIAEKMQESKRRIPHYAYVEEVDMTELEALRQHLNQLHAKSRPKLTVLPFFVRALSVLLPHYPQINATFDDDAGVLTRHAAFHAGIATQTPNGLMVAVLRHAEALDLWSCAVEIGRLAEAARSGKATREELTGSTLTLTSLGPLGGIATTPVINYPEVAIIGPNKIVDRPVVLNGQIAVRKMMNLSSSFDHRVVDGYDAAEFIQRLKAMLERPAMLFLE